MLDLSGQKGCIKKGVWIEVPGVLDNGFSGHLDRRRCNVYKSK